MPAAPSGEPRPRVGVSACLLGEAVRWDGGHRRDAFVTDVLGRWVEWVPVCPEVELGLGVPREPIRLEGDGTAPRLVAPGSGTDHTAAMTRLAARRAAALARMGLAGYVLKSGSPSCGMVGVPVHRARGEPRPTGVGVFARALMTAMPLLPVEEEGRLRDAALRENFVTRLFAADRWRRFRAGTPTRRGLAAFHTAHELLLRAHAPGACARLGRLVAGAGRRPPAGVIDRYGAGFMTALRRLATRRRHADVLAGVLARLGGGLSPADRRALADVVAAYRRGRVPLAAPLALVRRHVDRRRDAYLAAQVYLAAAPMLRDRR